ncbi:MAG: hypothetical protein R3B06_13460 [Kofleriaceae bacterium]
MTRPGDDAGVAGVSARTAVIVESLVTPAAAAAARARLAAAGYARYPRIDLGSYQACVAPDEPDLVAAAARAVEPSVGFPVVAEQVRAWWLGPGDYVLAHHDPPGRFGLVEVVVDLSPAPAAAEVHYRRRGQLYFVMPAVPGTAAIVERGPAVTSNHTYLSHRGPAAHVVRLIIGFVPR